MSRSSPAGKIAALYRYPVKSVQGEELEVLELTERGIRGDRALGLLDVETGLIASAHHPAKWGTLLRCAARTEASGIVMTLRDGREMPLGDQLQTTLGGILGRDVRLVTSPPERGAYEIVHPDVPGSTPPAFVEHTLSLAGPGAPVGRLGVALAANRRTLVDVAPVHLITDASLAYLAAHGVDTDVRRFRPNLVVSVEGSGFIENAWTGRRITIGDAALEGTFQTPRCIIPTISQQDIDPDKRPLQIIARDNRIDIGSGKWACFGLYANVVRAGVIHVGDAVSLDP